MGLREILSQSCKQPVHVKNKPETFDKVKSAPIPLAILSVSFVFYLLSKYLDTNKIKISHDVFEERPSHHIDEPYVTIGHDKSRQSSTGQLLEYVEINLWLDDINTENKKITTAVYNVLSNKIHKLTQSEYIQESFRDEFGNEKAYYKVNFRGHIKTLIIGESLEFLE